MRNTGLEEAWAGIKTAGRNINNLSYADDTTLMAESEEELKSLLMKVKEGVKKLAWNSTFKKLRYGEWNGDPLQYSFFFFLSISPALAGRVFTTKPPRKPHITECLSTNKIVLSEKIDG